MSEPAAKRRRLDPSGSQPQSQSSFADVLQKLKEDAEEEARTSRRCDLTHLTNWVVQMSRAVQTVGTAHRYLRLTQRGTR